MEKVPREIQGEKLRKDAASWGKNCLNNWSISKFQRDHVSRRVSVPCWHATPFAYAPWKLFGEGQARYQCYEIGGKSDRLRSHYCYWSRVRMSLNIRERETE